MTHPDTRSVRRSAPSGAPSSERARGRAGFTLIELITVMTIIGVVAGIALPSYQGMRERAQIAGAIAEIASLQQEINEFRLLNNRLPVNLGEIGRASDLDPWGRPYEYLEHSGATAADKRKDRFFVIVNTDYDLYSLGGDGVSSPPFIDAPARDDVVRANDGGFVGLAEVF